METIEQLKKNPDYLFKCNITANDYKIMTSCDVWDAAYIRCGSKGVEYNFCMDNGCNYSAIYMSDRNGNESIGIKNQQGIRRKACN